MNELRPALAGRTAIVSGAGRGLGLAISQACLQQGAYVVALDRDENLLASAVETLRSVSAIGSAKTNNAVGASSATSASSATGVGNATGVTSAKHSASAKHSDGERVRAVVCDISVESDVRRVFEDLADVAPTPLWGLVNNAALADGVGGQPFWEISTEQWEQVLRVNLTGTWLMSKYAARVMIPSAQGRIVNMASDAALYGSPRLGHYIASKGGVMALTRGMARDLGPHGICVNAIAPGLTVGASAENIPAERHELYAKGRAIERPQVADDVIGAATFLLSEESAFITGQTIVVDGGFVMN